MKTFKEKISETLSRPLDALDLGVLQVNLGFRCNLACKHCHVSGAPGRNEIMSEATVERVLEVFRENPFQTLDITGGAPELHPSLKRLAGEGRSSGKHVIVRTNLTIFFEPGMETYPEWYAKQGVELIASLPYYLEDGVDRIRGGGTYKKSIEALKRLNALGYGAESGGLPLGLVYNPQGTFLPPSQCSLESDYRRELKSSFGITFTRLYTFSNMPVGRFREFLVRTGNLDKYLEKLAGSFNPATLDGIMCRHMLSIGWDGSLHDCDFNQVLGLTTSTGAPRHIHEFDYARLRNRVITVDDHCFGCTAGQGSS